MSNTTNTHVETALGSSIRRIRREMGLSRERLAAQAGLSARLIQLIELNGHRPRQGNLLRIAHTLGVSVSDLEQAPALAA